MDILISDIDSRQKETKRREINITVINSILPQPLERLRVMVDISTKWYTELMNLGVGFGVNKINKRERYKSQVFNQRLWNHHFFG